MNFKVFIVLIVFALWSVFCWWWYVCKIKQKCIETKKTTIVLAQMDTLRPKDVPIDTLVKDTLKPVNIQQGKTVLYFKSNSVHFEEDSMINQYLTFLSKRLIVSKDTVITIIGHSDDVGEDSTNLRLSVQRAKDVRNFMLNKGVSYIKMKIEGKGENEPIINDTSISARRLNRRVEIVFNK